MNDLVGGHVDFLCEQSVSVAESALAGSVKAYAVSATERLATLPNVPTAREAGINYQMSIWAGLFAPKGTSPEVIAKLADALDKALDEPDVRERLAQLGGTGSRAKAERNPAAFDRFVRSEIARWAPILAANRREMVAIDTSIPPISVLIGAARGRSTLVKRREGMIPPLKMMARETRTAASRARQPAGACLQTSAPAAPNSMQRSGFPTTFSTASNGSASTAPWSRSGLAAKNARRPSFAPDRGDLGSRWLGRMGHKLRQRGPLSRSAAGAHATKNLRQGPGCGVRRRPVSAAAGEAHRGWLCGQRRLEIRQRGDQCGTDRRRHHRQEQFHRRLAAGGGDAGREGHDPVKTGT